MRDSIHEEHEDREGLLWVPRALARTAGAVAALAFFALVLAACGGGSHGLGRGEAIEAARGAAPGRDAITGVISAKSGRFSDFDVGSTDAVSSAGRQVWAVTFSGSFQASCGPAPLTPEAQKECPPPATTMLVIIDRADGTFIEALAPADAALDPRRAAVARAGCVAPVVCTNRGA